MRGLVAGAIVLAGIALVSVSASAQPTYGANQQTIAPPRQGAARGSTTYGAPATGGQPGRTPAYGPAAGPDAHGQAAYPQTAAQGGYGGPSGPGAYGQASSSQGGYGQTAYVQASQGPSAGQGAYPQASAQGGRGGPPGAGAYGQGGYGQGSYGQPTGQGRYAPAYNGQRGYAPWRPAPCRADDDLESLRCHHRFSSQGRRHESEDEAYYRGDHYRGYQDDGTGRREYYRGGKGVGHDDYTRDYDPIRGY